MVTLQLEDEEAEYLGDILQMWLEGIEQEVQGITETPDAELHWSKFQLRKQAVAAGAIKMRLDFERTG